MNIQIQTCKNYTIQEIWNISGITNEPKNNIRNEIISSPEETKKKNVQSRIQNKL